MNYYIGIDLVTSACNGILTNREGTILAEHSVSYPVISHACYLLRNTRESVIDIAAQCG